jgi:hypothetical protein
MLMYGSELSNLKRIQDEGDKEENPQNLDLHTALENDKAPVIDPVTMPQFVQFQEQFVK